VTLTAFLRDYTDLAGKPLLLATEYADLEAGRIVTKQLH
jgi:hypothetical protein